MSQKTKLTIERPTVIIEPGQSAKLYSGPEPNAKLEPEPCVKAETGYPTFKVEPGPSDSFKTETQRPTVIVWSGSIEGLNPEPSSKTDNEEPENEMESSDDLVSAFSEDDDDSDNPDNYHPTIIMDPFDDGDPYREPTDVGHLIVNLGNAKKMNFEADSNGDFKCPETSCKYIAKKKNHLDEHYKIHGEKRYECRICAKKFAQRHVCMNHIRTHDDRYKFRCDVCRKRYSVYQQLKRHSRDKHDIELGSRRRRWIIVPPGYERPMVPLPRYNSRGKLW